MKVAATLAVLAMCAAASFAPPAGRPPIGPAQRYDPKLYDLSFGVTLSTVQNIDGSLRENYRLKDAPIVMPVLFLNTYSTVHSDSLSARLWLSGREDTSLGNRVNLQDGVPLNEHLAVMTVAEFNGQSLRWQLNYRVQVWSSKINEEKAAEIAWPREWPEEVRDALEPQKYVESDDPIFAQAVQDASQGKLRLVPPYLAAKDLVRYCIEKIRVSGDGLAYEGDEIINPGVRRPMVNSRVLRGLELIGASEAAKTGQGGPHDLVCVCVATLRAAGIPARPVIGAEEDDKDFSRLVSWAEFYLPEAGWIPFDPDEMRGKGIRSMNVRRAWPEFGSMDDLNERIPLSFHFIPPATVESPRYPAIWGWDPRPWSDPSSTQAISIEITSRGKGVEDPQ